MFIFHKVGVNLGCILTEKEQLKIFVPVLMVSDSKASTNWI